MDKEATDTCPRNCEAIEYIKNYMATKTLSKNDSLISKAYAMLCAKYMENHHQEEYLQIIKESIEELATTKQIIQLHNKRLYMAMDDVI